MKDTAGQEALFPDAPRLTERQQRVDDAVEAGGCTAAEAGAVLHALKDCTFCQRAGAFGACDYAEQDGRQVLAALRKKGLAKRRKSGVWTRPDARDPGLSRREAAEGDDADRLMPESRPASRPESRRGDGLPEPSNEFPEGF